MAEGKHYSDGVCLHCGGSVDADGMSLGGEVESAENELPEEVDGDTSPQLEATKQLRDFANAVGGKR